VDGVTIFDNETLQIGYANPAACQLFGYSQEEILHRQMTDLHPSEAVPALRERIAKRKLGDVTRAEVACVRKEGSLLYAEITARHILYHQRSSTIGFFRDTTERRRLQESEERMRVLVEKERGLLRQLLDLHERDRQLVAYEIHDGFVQQLTGALMSLQAYEQLEPQHSPAAAAALAAAQQALRDAIAEARRLINGLRPPVLDESGIVLALEHLIGETQGRCAAEIEFTHDVQFDRLAPPLESAVYRIVQESLTNACRHSQSAKICVHLWQRDGQLRVRIRDWGIGFDPRQHAGNRFGLRGIRERARLLGGRSVIRSLSGHGATITVELPIVYSG
jgi:PAS domain S-box-containing protein